MEIIWATQDAKKGLESKLVDLKSKRGDIAEQIKVAREFGDLRENAEYAAAREAQNNLESEIIEIEAMIPTIKLFSYAKADVSCVNLGTKITVENKDTKEKAVYVITGILESNIEKGYVSNQSPIGTSLLGKKVGDIVEFKIPAGKKKYKITKIERP